MYRTLIVTDQSTPSAVDLNLLSLDDYLGEYPKLNEDKTRVINLCDTTRYLSRGYYCSLLAESREHKVLPSVSTINDLRNQHEVDSRIIQLPADAYPKQIDLKGLAHEIMIFFGWTPDDRWSKAARCLFDTYSAPFLKATFQQVGNSFTISLQQGNLVELDAKHSELFHTRLNDFTKRIWRKPVQRLSRWDLAILYDPEEENSPSNPEAIKRFVKAANKLGVDATVLPSKEMKHLTQFDGLFIRETTRIDHATYRLARRGEMEGLVVMDDATSILRCCNKIFLHDAFTYKGVQSPKTIVVSSDRVEEIQKVEEQFSYPMVLKMPESSFSLGVYKVENLIQLCDRLSVMFRESALVLVQEYLFTEFDWRIGVLNGRAIYACKYLMARNHWQIYNHGSSKKTNQAGGFETMPTFEAPRPVIEAALKASSIIGKGLYGVDIKQKGDQVYVIEVNDNPNIDHKVEDLYLGDELYTMIMQEFVNRMEKRGLR